MQGWLDDYFATKCMLGEHHAKQLCVATPLSCRERLSSAKNMAHEALSSHAVVCIVPACQL